MSYITTCTGKHFDPMKPVIEEIDLVDIAHPLSLMCRANGHMRLFYSVAQHSIACAREAAERGLSKEIIIASLLHDGSEAYLSDMTRPVKQYLDFYLKVEDKLQNMIWERFLGRPITDEERKAVFEIDDEMLAMEFHQLMPEDLGDDYKKLIRPVACEFKPFKDVEEEFIILYEEVK